ncbi:CRAL-TRIO domain-containing protein [Sporobolomyces salmoneus]|uniref:CRAL-TRIO domain-containing protein n=1 Tax=Sporobolomyces salmoneus TaxID=183962 RepID=UPI00317DBB1C
MSTSFESTLPSPPSTPDEPFSYPVAQPSSSSKPLPPRAALTSDQQEKLTKLIDHFNAPDFKLPGTLKELKQLWLQQGKETGSRFGGLFGGAKAAPIDEASLTPLNDIERCYWSSQAFQRCLRATKWDYLNALKRAEETLVWRREFKVEEMREEDVSREGETGKELVFGFDKDCRPVLYMHPYRQNTQTGPDQIAFVVWCLERALDLAPATDPATEMLCLCIDFGANLKDTKSQPTTLSQARKVLEILQTYYCERLGKAICVNIPGFFFTFYKLVSPFVDPVTKEKIRFLEGQADATSLIPPEQLQRIFGGSVNFEYDHSKYFPALTKLCFGRKEECLRRWKEFGGGLCGVDEAIIRGGRKPEGVKSEEKQEEKVPTEEMAAVKIDEKNESEPMSGPTSTSTSTRTSPEGTVVDESSATSTEPTTPGLDKFVDAPVASEGAVKQAIPALTA